MAIKVKKYLFLLFSFISPEIKNEFEIQKLITDFYNKNEIYVTNEILEFFLSQEKSPYPSYNLVTFGEISQIEEYLKNCKISNEI
jgi:hypothetical protein